MIAALLLAAGLTVAPVGPSMQDARERPRDVAAIEACAQSNGRRLAQVDAEIAAAQARLANAEERLRSWRIPSTRTVAAQRERELDIMGEIDVRRVEVQTLVSFRDTLRHDDRC